MELRISKSRFDERARIVAQRDVYGFSLIEAYYQPGLRISNHSHEKANFCIALTGTCTELYRRKLREYKPLSLDYLPPDHVHSLAFGDVPLRCFTVNIDQHILSNLREQSLVLDESAHCQGGPLAWLFMRLYKEFLENDTASVVAIEGLMLEMLAAASRKTVVIERRTPGWLKEARQLVRARFLEDLRLATVSEAVGVHPVHLCREFRRHYHSTVGDYIRKLRIEHAVQEMLNPDISLGKIASSAGFADQSHFARIFRRFVGMSPAAFRATLSGR